MFLSRIGVRSWNTAAAIAAGIQRRRRQLEYNVVWGVNTVALAAGLLRRLPLNYSGIRSLKTAVLPDGIHWRWQLV